MGWARDTARAFIADAQKVAGVDLSAFEQQLEDMATSTFSGVRAGFEEESKKAAACALLKKAIDEGAYGDPTKEPIRTILADFEFCYDLRELNRLTLREWWDQITIAG